ncbi:MAG: hypothetical protein LC791_11440 [Acidobacteria bacterium]|nr:hypothetical protein [Acidobacteriota bacterium]
MREVITTVIVALVLLCADISAQDSSCCARASTPKAWSAATMADERPSLGRIFGAIGQDVRRLPSRDAVETLGIAAALALAALPSDRALTAHAHGSSALDRSFEAGDVLGEAWTHFGGAMGTVWLGGFTGHRRTQALGAGLARAQAVNAIYTTGLKAAVGRERPNGGTRSFPSGHSSATFAAATVLRHHYGWKVGLPAYAVASYVAASRLQANSHYVALSATA